MNNDLLSELNQFSGTDAWHRVSHLPVLVTDGVLHLCENAGAFWLVDAIGSYLPKIVHSGDRMATCKLRKRENDWILTIETLEGKISQEIEYSDFPLKEITLYLCDNGFSWCLMLTNEY